MDDPFANAEHLKGVRALLEGLREETLFMTASMGLILNFVNRAHYVGLERLKHTPWRY